MIRINAYGLIVGVAVAVYYLLTQRTWEQAGLKKEKFSKVFVAALLFALMGARLYHVVDYWDYYRNQPQLILAIWQGGLGIIGAIVFLFLFMLIYARVKHLPLWQLFNVFSEHLLIAQAIGRLANFFSTGGIVVEAIPLTFAYVTYQLIIAKRSTNRNLTFSYYLISFGLIRTFSDSVRNDLWYLIDHFSVSTAVAILMILGGLVVLFLSPSSKNR